MRCFLFSPSPSLPSFLPVQVPPEADPERAAEIQARRRAREARHRESGKRERSPTQATPPPFTESASAEVKEKFRVDDGAEEASRTLVFWLEKGICNRHNTDKFFPLVQSADGCMKRVMRSKKDHEIDVRRFIADSQLKQDCLKRQSMTLCSTSPFDHSQVAIYVFSHWRFKNIRAAR